MKLNVFLLLLIFSVCQSQPSETQPQPKDYTSTQVAEDIRYLKSQLDRFHPGLNRYTAKVKMDQHFEEAAIAPNGLEAEELYGRVTFLLSQVKCGHTRTNMPDALREKHVAENRFVPFYVQLLGTEPYVSASLVEEMPVGARITKINGKNWEEIESAIFSHLPADGMIETGKRRMMGSLFPYYYQLYVDRSDGALEIEWVSKDEQVKKAIVSRTRYADLEGISTFQQKETELTLNHHGNYSYMRISTFGQQSLNNAGMEYERFLKQSFKTIKSQGVENLILDLRGNGGGRDNYGALLVSYLLPQEFGYFDNIQVTPDYSGYGGVVERDGKHFVTSHQGLSQWQPQEDVFEGNLFVMIDGGSFSTCADVATVLHHNNRGAFLGEETGGGYDGNTSGNTKTITLPHSSIRVYVPLWMYTTANVGHHYPGRGVIPDYEVVPSWEEYESNEDVVMKRVLELIE